MVSIYNNSDLQLSFLCPVYMINRDNEMVPVSVVDTDEDAHASVEDQNMEIDPPIDGGISCLHESAHEIDKEKNGMHLVNNDMYQQQGDAESVVEVSNVHANCTTGDIMDVPYPYFTDLCQNGYLWRVKARLVRMVEVINPLLPSMTLRLILLDEQHLLSSPKPIEFIPFFCVVAAEIQGGLFLDERRQDAANLWNTLL
ncbi:hypothetical protein RHSIM_Rhsim07G0044300 [Rhododendron simsii]|uniref:Uncharacterized protein n=1 Tax=Rhododendron simsii TaxID=118357 RepID=A0A834GUB4_RHOSS|nr:hypothetical protein RHSIM_Rhsim07G0044300 [Rhododendron simsii]